jgi:hypothetical protein
MQNHPDIIWLRIQLDCSSVVDGCRLVVNLAETGQCPDLIKWSIPASAKARKGSPVAVLNRIETGALRLKQENATLTFVDGGSVNIFRPYDDPFVQAEFSYMVTTVSADVRRGMLANFRSWVVALCQRRQVLQARSVWTGPGADCLPDAAVAGMRGQIVVTDEPTVREHYDDLGGFWSAWDERLDFGEKVLLVRALSATDGPELLERLLPRQWALARAAKPGRTRYSLPRPLPDEEPIYHRGRRRMKIVGYDSAIGTIELACSAAPGQHLQGWEIFNLWYPLATGKNLDGNVVKEAKVVFLESMAAEQEKRPLLDIGARVFVQGPRGEVEVEP